ncbi:MAG: FAD-dependent oxidoreductase [Acidobacteriota bacterium]|nr:FAD-dependent oxidoreductase [Acidobacteriota bacterium]MDQ7088988.1 FAD-dependent oxidoreductase [Acidobacteriota bacterium]
MGSRRHAPRALVVGAGLTGAALAWTATRAGLEVHVVSAERPASQGTSLAPGIVHGLGPPGGILRWAGLSDAELEGEARRVRQGHEILREVLLAARAHCGYRRLGHRMLLPPGLEQRAGDLAGRLRRAGFEVDVESTERSVVLSSRREALVSPRRLVFELLAQARAGGAVLRQGGVRPAQQAGDGGQVIIGGRIETFDRVYWATGGPPPGGTGAQAACTGRMVLRQSFAAGEAALDEVLVAEDGDLALVPDPQGRSRVVLLRRGVESRDAGLCWPQPPEAWGRWMGPVVHQRLAEAWALPMDRLAGGARPQNTLTGLDGWPVCAVLGAAGQLVEGDLPVPSAT